MCDGTRMNLLEQLADAMQKNARRLTALEAHVVTAIPPITTDFEARRRCELVLHDLNRPHVTTTEVALATYLLKLLGDDQRETGVEGHVLEVIETYPEIFKCTCGYRGTSSGDVNAHVAAVDRNNRARLPPSRLPDHES